MRNHTAPSSLLLAVAPTVPNDLVTVEEGAKLAQKKPQTIWKHIRQGKLRAWGTRRCYLISVSELLKPVAVLPLNRW